MANVKRPLYRQVKCSRQSVDITLNELNEQGYKLVEILENYRDHFDLLVIDTLRPTPKLPKD